jgi:hypothetical protein
MGEDAETLRRRAAVYRECLRNWLDYAEGRNFAIEYREQQ